MDTREAFQAGWAVYALGMGQRGPVVLRTALELEDRENPDYAALVYEAARKNGLREACEDRRASLRDHWAGEFSKVLIQIRKAFPTRRYVKVVLADLNEAKADPGQAERRRNAARAAALAALTITMENRAKLLLAWRTLNAEARSAGMAEGWSEGTAFLAELTKAPPVDMDALYSSSLDYLRNLDQFWDQADSWLSDQMKGLANDLGRVMANSIEQDLTVRQMQAAVNDAIDLGDGAQFYMDEAIHTSVQEAALGAYQQAGIGLVDFVTEGDNKVCPTCEDLEDENPWGISEVPAPPVHGGCRCFIEPLAGAAAD